jgi:hypothetical protein
VNGGGSVSGSTSTSMSAGTALFASKSGRMISSLFHSSLTKVNQYFSQNLILLILTWVISAMITKLVMKLEREFKEEYREKDMDKIPTIWSNRL